jgi:hypothetical protein
MTTDQSITPAAAATRPVAARGSFRDIITAAEALVYPYSCCGTIRSRRTGHSFNDAHNQLAGSGVLVGPYHLLTATHLFDTRPLSGWDHYFLPAYHAAVGGPRTDTKLPTHFKLTGRIIAGDPRIGVEGALDLSGGGGWLDVFDIVSGWDFVICELESRAGDHWGQMGVIWGGEGFYTGRRWTTIGYPISTEEGRVPSRVRDLIVDEADTDDFSTREIETERRFSVGWSGGPLFTERDGEWYVAGVLSGQDADGIDLDGVYVFAGGRRLGDVHTQAHRDWRVGPPTATSDAFGYRSAATHHIVYRSYDGDVVELYVNSKGQWNFNVVSLSAGAPKAAAGAAPRAYITQPGNGHHIVYRAVDNNIIELFINSAGSWTWNIITAAANWAPLAASDPFGYPGPSPQHVVYRSVDDDIVELFIDGAGRWAHNVLTAI